MARSRKDVLNQHITNLLYFLNPPLEYLKDFMTQLYLQLPVRQFSFQVGQLFTNLHSDLLIDAPNSHRSGHRHPRLSSFHISRHDRASCLKPSQPRAPCFPSRHSFLPGAPLEEGGSSGDRTTQTAPRPWPDAFLETERGCSFSSTISPFISYVSAISCALGGLRLSFSSFTTKRPAFLFQEGKKKHSNKFLQHEWWEWRCQCVTLKRATSMVISETTGATQILLPLNGLSVPRRGNACCLSAQKCVYNLRLCFSRPLTDSHKFCLRRFQRHVHTYRILPDADGLLAVQVSFVSGAEFA